MILTAKMEKNKQKKTVIFLVESPKFYQYLLFCCFPCGTLIDPVGLLVTLHSFRIFSYVLSNF